MGKVGEEGWMWEGGKMGGKVVVSGRFYPLHMVESVK